MQSLIQGSWRFLAVVFCGTLLLTACQSEPELTAQQRRQLTTRSIEAPSPVVFKALMTVFQDEGYLLSHTDMDAGLISAEIRKKRHNWLIVFAQDRHEPRPATDWYAINATISKLENGASEVRFVIQKKVVNNYGGVGESRIIYDAATLDTLFNRLRVEAARRLALKKR